ncbi:MAG TPA: dihydroorotase, partial [Gammaproteobacteria bacterium]|nr:dihydroorotase [Gammaproteobacteria bacterium]
MDKITFTQPDDWHVHLREGDALNMTVRATARCFARAIVMPNLSRPIDNIIAANTYRKQILAALPSGHRFEPLMTLYLTENLKINDIHNAQAANIHGVKLYPKNATTGSASGIQNIEKVYPILEAMQQNFLPLLIHGE